MMSPIAPSRTTRIRTAGLGSLTPLYMIDQVACAPLLRGLLANYLVGLNRRYRCLDIRVVEREHVVYHAQSGGQLGSRPRIEQWSSRIEHGRQQGQSIRQFAQTPHKARSQHVKIA